MGNQLVRSGLRHLDDVDTVNDLDRKIYPRYYLYSVCSLRSISGANAQMMMMMMI